MSGEDEEGKLVLDCAGFPSFTNRRRRSDRELTKATVAHRDNEQFKVIHRTKTQMKTRNMKVKQNGPRHNLFKQKPLSVHEIVDKIVPIVLIESEDRLMNNKT